MAAASNSGGMLQPGQVDDHRVAESLQTLMMTMEGMAVRARQPEGP